jgi:hypothetical protein
MRNDNHVLAAKEVQNPLMDALIRRAQLINAVAQEIGNWTS